MTSERRQIHAGVLRRMSWGAIIGGAFVGLAAMALLQTLGVAIGASALATAEDRGELGAIGVGAGVWSLASGILASLAAGATAAWLARQRRRYEGPVHGFLAWAFMLVGASLMASGAGLGHLVALGGFATSQTSDADLVAQAAWWAFGSLLLGGAASMVGGALGAPRPRALPVRRA